MGAGVGRPHVQMLCRYGVLPPCRGGLSSLTYGYTTCFSSGAGPPALGPEASPTPSWNSEGSLVGRGFWLYRMMERAAAGERGFL